MKNPLWWTVTVMDSREKALELGEAAVERGFAACAQIEGPITSIYRWDGEMHRDTEVRLVLKSSPEKAEALMDWLRSHHPYKVPEIVAWPVALATPDYQKWVEKG